MQFLRNQLPDFKNSWSCLILTLLRIKQCTTYPPHLSYATTLPCKTLTMNITFFIVMLVLKSEENIACYQFHTLWKQFISRRFQSVRPQLSHKLEVFLTMFSMALLIEFCGRSSPCGLQDFLQLVYSSTDMMAKRVEVRWVPWPFVFSEKSLQLAAIQFWASFAVWHRRSVLLEYETRWHKRLAIFNQFW